MSLDLETILYSIGVNVIKESGDELVAKCPMHLQRTGKEDGNPSWSINSRSYAHHCFSCGYSGSLVSLYRDLVGDPPEDLEWELSKQSVVASLNKEKEAKESHYEGPNIDEWSLSQYVDVPQRLIERRHLLRSSVDHFGIRWDKQQKVWVIPVRTPSGHLMGYQFRQKGIVLNHPAGMEKSKTLFGIHLFTNESRITIVESPLDAVRFYNIGVPAVSSFGAAVSKDQLDLLARNFRSVVCAMDNDAAGSRSKEILHRSLKKRGCVVTDFNYFGLDAKDPGDVVSDEQLLKAWHSGISLGLVTH